LAGQHPGGVLHGLGQWQQLSPDQREMLLLSMVAGLTAPEVAAALGKTVGEVKALCHRALAALAGVLDLPSSY
jgi:DNA-directed RNA polymerase specialized sigma24 family protein